MSNNFIRQTNPIPKPPFLGARCIEKISLLTIIPYINLDVLYKFQWGFKQDSAKQSDSVFNRLIAENRKANIIQLQALYGYFACQSVGDELVVYNNSSDQKELCRFLFPRQATGNHLCVADYFKPQSSKELDVVAFQLVTVGQQASAYARELFQQNKYQEYLYWRGLNAEIAAAMAEFVHKQIRVELGFAAEEPRDIKDVFKQKYHGARFSFGYPSCPNLEDQEKILALLDAERIGVKLNEVHQLLPEESTSAIIVHHPQAEHFVVRTL